MINITVRQYSLLLDATEYDVILDCIKPKNGIKTHRFKFFKVIKSMNINSISYVNVKYCIKQMTKANNWDVIQNLFEVCFDITAEQFWNMSVVEFFQAKKYMVAEFKRVVATEAKVLASQSTDEHMWEMAGADKLKPHNDTLPLVQLGKLFGQYPFDIGRKPYSEVFSLLVQVKVQNEVESEYQKLITK